MTINIDDIEYDFGFSTISEEEYNSKIQPPTPTGDPALKEDLQVYSTMLTNIEKKINDVYNMIDYQMSDSDEHKERLNNAYKERMTILEQLIVPLLNNLLKTADNEYIYWPNRRAILEKQIEKIKSLTRDENIFVN